ncbi:hypothetical protein PYCC9005_004818 [Savitreella phatthalungensis]
MSIARLPRHVVRTELVRASGRHELLLWKNRYYVLARDTEKKSTNTRDTHGNQPASDSQIDKKESRKDLSTTERDEQLMQAYREKLGGDATAQFEDGKASEMKRSVRNNMFRCKCDLLRKL